MKAVVYKGPRDVAVKDVPDATDRAPTDVLVRITSTNICGSDLHMYEGRTEHGAGRVFGHENMGEVIEVGGRQKVKVGDRVCCRSTSPAASARTANGPDRLLPDRAPEPALPGPPMASPTWGPTRAARPSCCGCRSATSTAWGCREDAAERQTDYVMLADIFPTGYHATEMAGVKPGDSVVIFGAGPGRADGRLLRDAQGSRPGDGRGPPPRPLGARREDRRHPGRRLRGTRSR